MKYSILCLFFLIIVSCKDAKKESGKATEEVTQEDITEEKNNFYGEKFDISSPIQAENVLEKYKNMKPGDTLEVSFQSKVNSVCKKKGCWMRLELPENKESLVRFKDYGFFVPKDIENQTAIVHGKAYVDETSIEDLKHYAKDAGKSEEEITAITEPELTLAFEADGVYLQ